MSHVFVKAEPKGCLDGASVTHYVLELSHGVKASPYLYANLKDAVEVARQMGHHPLVAIVRDADKTNPDHWRSA